MFGETPLVMVPEHATVAEVVEAMRGEPVIGVDTEGDSFHHYQEKVCLIQLSDSKQDYIIDPLAVDDLSPLAEIFEDPDVVKVFHGADYDVVCMKRDFQFNTVNIFDTMLAAQFLSFPRIGLADLIGKYFGHKIDKKYQRHDWAKRPLYAEHLDYARGDTHFLLAIRDVLKHRLETAGKTAALEEECLLVQEREWSGRKSSPVDFLRVKKSNTLDKDGLKVLRELWAYRDGQAKRMDLPAFKVIPGPILLQLAQVRPVDEDGLYTVLRKKGSLVRRHGPQLVKAVSKGLASEEPLPDKKKAAPRGERRKDAPGMDRVFAPLKNWRNAKVKAKGLNPVVVVSNNQLKEIARVAPKDLECLALVPTIRNWQIEAFGEEIITIVGEALTRPSSADEPGTGRRRRNRRRRGPRTEGGEGGA
jgi:ribonuclease D